MLLSLWLLAALVAGTMGAAGGLCIVERARRRRRRAGTLGPLRATIGRALSVGVVVALAVVSFADHENRQYQYIPSFSALFGNVSPNFRHGGLAAARTPQGPAPSRHGVVVKVDIPGVVSGVRSRAAYVYLPAAYFDATQPARRFPVYYLLHGSPGVAVDWVRGGRLDQAMNDLASAGRIKPFIVVMPDTNGGYRRDLECQNTPGGIQDETYLATDVVGYVDARLRSIADRGSRVIGGLSTGGYCAVNLAFHHQDTYSAVVSHSGSGRPDHGIYTGNLFGGRTDLRRANTPDDYLHTSPIRSDMAVYLETGRSDHWSTHETASLRRVLMARRVATTNLVSPGGHNFGTWRRGLYRSLPWVSDRFQTTATIPPPGELHPIVTLKTKR